MNLSQKAVDIRIGKRGISEALINEIKVRLKKKKIVKLKFLAAFLNSIDGKRRQIIEKSLELITKFSNSQIVEVRGNTAVLQQKLKNK